MAAGVGGGCRTAEIRMIDSLCVNQNTVPTQRDAEEGGVCTSGFSVPSVLISRRSQGNSLLDLQLGLLSRPGSAHTGPSVVILALSFLCSEVATLHVKLGLGFLTLDWMEGIVLLESRSPQEAFLSGIRGQPISFFLRP